MPQKARKRGVTFAPGTVTKIIYIPSKRGVSFAPKIVTDVWEIPRYGFEELSNFFYSEKELLMFLKDFIDFTKINRPSRRRTVERTKSEYANYPGFRDEEKSRTEYSDLNSPSGRKGRKRKMHPNQKVESTNGSGKKRILPISI